MRPWLVVSVGLLVAVAAIYALVTGVFEGDSGSAKQADEEIDSRSRTELRDLLRQPDPEAKR